MSQPIGKGIPNHIQNAMKKVLRNISVIFVQEYFMFEI